ncbi:FkbM family methyltransferase [Achromobacter aegrifaciens]
MNHTSITQTAYGEFTYFTHDDPIGLSLSRYGEWAQDEIEFLRGFIPSNGLIVDIGANIGTHTVSFSHFVGPNGHVIAFEPQPAVFEVLQRNVNQCALPNVQCICAGAGSETRELELAPLDYSSHNNFGAVSLNSQGQGDGIKIPIKSVDSLNLEHCALIKIDAEGMELDVLKGLQQTIARCHPLLFIECNDANDGIAFFEYLQSSYEIFLISTAAYNATNFKGNADNFFGVAHESSLLCLPIGKFSEFPPQFARTRVKSVRTPSELAIHHFEVPRYGDQTDHDRDSARLREICSQKEASLAAKEEELSKAKFRETSLRHTRDLALSQVASLQDCTDEAARLRQEVADIRSSTSWRLTSPLRVMMNLARRFLR